MIWRGGVPLGFDRDTNKPISYDGNAPVLVIGPPGSNKTVGIVINQLLDDESQPVILSWTQKERSVPAPVATDVVSVT